MLKKTRVSGPRRKCEIPRSIPQSNPRPVSRSAPFGTPKPVSVLPPTILSACREPMLDVVIVGLGPVGAVTAHLLSMYGLKVLAVDRDAEMFNKPRAIAADQETMRTVQRIGCADELEPMLGYYPPSVFVAADGTFLRQISPASPPYALSWPSYGSFVQPELDAMLRRRLADRKDVEIRLDAEVVSISQVSFHSKLVRGRSDLSSI